MIFVIVVHDHFRVRYGSVGHESNLDNSVFEDAAPRAMFDEDQEQQHNEPPPMHRSKSSLGAQSRGTLFLHTFFYTFFGCSFNNFFTLLVFHLSSPSSALPSKSSIEFFVLYKVLHCVE